MSNVITGVFPDRRSAEAAVGQLYEKGFSQQDISMLMSDATRGREFGVEGATKAPEGAVTGATTGGVLGAVAAGLIAVGVIAVPGLGLVAAGPLLAILAGAGAGGAAGGLIGGLVGAGVPEHEATLYADELSKGSILVGVTAEGDRADAAKSILKSTGAKAIGSK